MGNYPDVPGGAQEGKGTLPTTGPAVGALYGASQGVANSGVQGTNEQTTATGIGAAGGALAGRAYDTQFGLSGQTQPPVLIGLSERQLQPQRERHRGAEPRHVGRASLRCFRPDGRAARLRGAERGVGAIQAHSSAGRSCRFGGGLGIRLRPCKTPRSIRLWLPLLGRSRTHSTISTCPRAS